MKQTLDWRGGDVVFSCFILVRGSHRWKSTMPDSSSSAKISLDRRGRGRNDSVKLREGHPPPFAGDCPDRRAGAGDSRFGPGRFRVYRSLWIGRRRGCSNTQLFEAEMTKAILARAKRKILLADASKWERPSIVRFAEWNEVDDWSTDKPRTAEKTKRLKSFELNVHSAHDGKRTDPALRF